MKESTKKIVFSANSAWNLWNFRFGVMKKLKNEGYEIICLAPDDEYSKKLSEEFEFFEIKNLSRKGVNPIKDLLLFFEYLKKYIKIKPNYVINYTVKPCVWSSFACQLLKIDCVSMITGLGYGFMKNGIIQKILKFLYSLTLNNNQKVIFLNEDDKNFFIKSKIIKEEKAEVWPGEGVDTDFFSSGFCKVEENNKIIFLMIARVLYDKGVMEFFEASSIIKKKYPETEFQLLGPIDNGNPSALNKKDFEKIKESVKYLGVTNDVRSFICNSSVVVLPSYKEGLPRTLIEAMSMEKPIIATDISGHKILKSEDNFFVPTKDANALADAFEKFILLPHSQKVEMGKKNRESVIKNFDEKIIFYKYKDLIKL